jgi:hypothetical protein
MRVIMKPIPAAATETERDRQRAQNGALPMAVERHRLRSPRPSDARAAWSGFKRLTQLGFPRSFPIVQFPNAPLALAFLAGQLATRVHAQAHADAAAISYLALTVWAYEELVHGVNWFRRLLGLAYLISTAVHLALALHHG